MIHYLNIVKIGAVFGTKVKLKPVPLTKSKVTHCHIDPYFLPYQPVSSSQGNTTLTTALPLAVDNNGILINASDIKITSHYNYNCQNTLFHLRSSRDGLQEGRGWEERQSHKSQHKKSQAYCPFEK